MFTWWRGQNLVFWLFPDNHLQVSDIISAHTITPTKVSYLSKTTWIFTKFPVTRSRNPGVWNEARVLDNVKIIQEFWYWAENSHCWRDYIALNKSPEFRVRETHFVHRLCSRTDDEIIHLNYLAHSKHLKTLHIKSLSWRHC